MKKIKNKIKIKEKQKEGETSSQHERHWQCHKSASKT